MIMSLNCQVKQTQRQKFDIAAQLQPWFPQCKSKETFNHYLQGTNKPHICCYSKNQTNLL